VQGVKSWHLLIYGLIIITVVLAVFYFANLFHFKDWVTQLSSNLHLGNFSLNGITTWVQQNSIIVGVIATLGTTAVTYLIKNYQANQLLNAKVKELSEQSMELMNTQSLNDKASAEIENLRSQVSEFNSDTTASALQEKIGLLTNSKEKLESDLQSIQNMHTNFLNSLTKAANGETIIDPLTQETLKVIKQVTTVIK
jgi:type VI protein secretion system component VasK